jgi:hypothetical protein
MVLYKQELPVELPVISNNQSFQQQNETMKVLLPAAAECAEAPRQQSTYLHDVCTAELGSSTS